MDTQLAQYVEEVALFWEQQGLPRIAGRILGLLMVCDPPHRSARQIAEQLSVSKGSVSTMVRLLLASGSIEVVAIPGERATHYRLSPDSIEQKLERRLQAMVGFQGLADRGLALLADAPDAQRERLLHIRDLYAFLGEELPLLIARWRQRQDG